MSMKKWIVACGNLKTKFTVAPNTLEEKSYTLETMGISEKPRIASAVMWEDGCSTSWCARGIGCPSQSNRH